MENNFIKENKTIEYDNERVNIFITKYENPVLSGECGLDEKSFKAFQDMHKQGFSLSLNENTLVAKSGSKKAKFKVRAYEELLINNAFDKSIQVKANHLKQAMKYASKNVDRYSGVYVSTNSVCATDSMIMYIANGYAPGGVQLDINFIKNILTYPEEEYTIEFNQNVCRTTIKKEAKEIEIYGRLIASQFPSLEKILSKTFGESLELNREDLKELIKYSSLGDEIVINTSDNLIKATGSIEIEEELKSDTELKFKLSYEHLLKVLQTTMQDTIKLEINDCKMFRVQEEEQSIIFVALN